MLEVEGSWFRLTDAGDGVTLIRELLIDTGSGLRWLRRDVALPRA